MSKYPTASEMVEADAAEQDTGEGCETLAEVAERLKQNLAAFIELVDDRQFAESLKRDPTPDYLAIAGDWWPELADAED